MYTQTHRHTLTSSAAKRLQEFKNSEATMGNAEIYLIIDHVDI